MAKWLLGAALTGAASLALAQQPPPPPAKAPPGPPPPAQTPPKAPANADEVPDGFLEFLGDDVSDPNVWEFVKRAHPKGNPPPPVPPQDAKP